MIKISRVLNKDIISFLKNKNSLKYNRLSLNFYKKCIVLNKLKKDIKY